MKKSPYSSIAVRSGEEGIPSEDNPDVLSLPDQEVRRFGQDAEHRRWLVEGMMWVVGIWLGLVLLITAFSEILLHITPWVMCTLLATTTINVLGLSKIILNGLFKTGGGKRFAKSKSVQ